MNDLDRNLDRVDHVYRLCGVGNLNGWVRDSVKGV